MDDKKVEKKKKYCDGVIEDEPKYIFVCEKCNYKVNLKSSYEKHLLSVLHKTGKRKIRCDKKIKSFKCEICGYTTTIKYNYNCHVLNNHSTKDERKEKFKYYCEKCDFGCFVKSGFETHKKTKSHIMKSA